MEVSEEKQNNAFEAVKFQFELTVFSLIIPLRDKVFLIHPLALDRRGHRK